MGYNRKKTDGTSSVKGHLVTRGFEESLTERTDSPICSKQSLRVLFSVASIVNWAIESIDLKAAFLKGDGLERDVFIHPPKKISKPGKLLKFVGYLVCMMKLVQKSKT